MFTNRTSHADFVTSAIDRFASAGTSVDIAVPFFTECDVIRRLADRGCDVRLIVRLGFPTKAEALETVLGNERVKVRYYTDPGFHSKLFIFGDRVALVGSANLTGSALKTNQEIMITVLPEDRRFEELEILFGEYWYHAEVLTRDALKKYEYLCSKHDEATDGLCRLEEDVVKQMGRVVFPNVTREGAKTQQSHEYLSHYRRIYQDAVTAFNEVKSVYEEPGKRKVPEGSIPLRIEIDSFLSFVRARHAAGNAWKVDAIADPGQRAARIRPLVDEWWNTEWPWFERDIVNVRYPRLVSVFGSPQSLKEASKEELFEALCVVHSFHDRFRFYEGGFPKFKEVFFSVNERATIDKCLTYLVFGGEEIVQRMCDSIYGAYKLNAFGKANVQEIVGWLNREDLPIINGRTTKVLSYFGFKVTQCSEE